MRSKTGSHLLSRRTGCLLMLGSPRKRNRPDFWCRFSLDGAIPQCHDAVRGQGVFQKALDGISTLVSGGAYTILSLVCHESNVAQLEAFYALGHTLGVNEVRFIPLKRIGGAETSGLRPVCR